MRLTDVIQWCFRHRESLKLMAVMSFLGLQGSSSKLDGQKASAVLSLD